MEVSKNWSRRTVLSAGALTLASCSPPKSILVHEHILVDFAGAELVSRSRYVQDEVIAAAKPKLEAIAKLGCVRFLECTPNYLGRDPRLLAKLSESCSIEIWTNTGLYAANQYRHLPAYARTETALELAKRWITEWRDGIEGTKPRFIKIGVNNGPLAELDRKMVEAAAIASLETGLTIASHTGRNAAPEQVEILQKLRFPLTKFVWVHAQNEKDHQVHAAVARAGGWVEFDGIGPKTLDWHKDCVEFMAKEGLLGRVLISQDTGWWRVGEPGGGQFNGYDFIYRNFLPQIPQKWWHQLLWENPRRAFGN
jgi:phosphotriesterase-related protein